MKNEKEASNRAQSQESGEHRRASVAAPPGRRVFILNFSFFI
jgi:hypothetical protein